MASINFGPFGDNGYLFPPINLLSLAESLNPFKPSQNPSFFASISSSKNSAQKPSSKHSTKKPEDAPEDPEKHRKLLQTFYWECHNRPDHRHTPEVEKILTDTVFENKDNPTSEEVEENEEWWEEFRSSPVVRFIQRSEEIADSLNQEELAANAEPYRKEDAKMWKAVPNVIGLDGRPMPRKAIRTDEESDAKFWDFARQFFFGLWGFRQRPYPPGKPIDVSQAIGYKRLETRYYDFIMKTSGWFYKDRLGHSRGPMELIQLKTAWGGGIIDKHTFVWGDDMDEWAPIGMVYGLERAIASWDVRLGAAATAFLHKLQKGIPPWVPLKGHENKTYKQLQEEAVESKRRDLAVLEANGGVWPGVRIPSHSMFLWASGSELSSILEADHMPNKCIPKDLRIQLAKVIPGLRPWEVLSLEQAMDKIMFGGQWYRDELGSYTTGIPFVEEWNEDVLEYLKGFTFISSLFCEAMEESIPGFGKFVDKYDEQSEALRRRRLEEKKKAEAKKAWDEALGVKSTTANENAENESDS